MRAGGELAGNDRVKLSDIFQWAPITLRLEVIREIVRALLILLT